MGAGVRAIAGAAVLLATPLALHLAFASGVPAPRAVRLAWALPWAATLWLFARSLAPGREPLVTAIARICRDRALPPALVGYTRQVTIAWCVFLALVIGVLAALALVASLEAWSFFANVLAWPLVALMFAAEYAFRRFRHRGHEHVPPLVMIERLARAGWRGLGLSK
jgi:uncharacterized membrane protein